MSKSKGLGFDAEPPPLREPKYDWPAIAAAARSRPRQPYLVARQGLWSTAVSMRGHLTALKPHKGFTVRTANTVSKHVDPQTGETIPRKCDIWVTYDPDLDEEREKDAASTGQR